MIKKSNVRLIAIVFSCISSVVSLAMDGLTDARAKPPVGLEEDHIKWTIDGVGQNGILIRVDAGAYKHSSALCQVSAKLRSEPLELLKDCERLKGIYEQQPENYKQLADENPIFLLGECTHTQCGLTRQSDRIFCPRDSAKELISRYVLPYLKNKDNPVVASYASGELFFDLDLLQTLSDQDMKIRKFIAIDPEFKPIIAPVLFQNLFGKVSPSQLLTQIDTPGIAKNLTLNGQQMAQAVRRVQQFLRALVFLNGCEGGQTIELYLFSDAASSKSVNLDIDFAFGMDYRVCGRQPWEYIVDINVVIYSKLVRDGIFADFSMNKVGKFHATIYQLNSLRANSEIKIFETK